MATIPLQGQDWHIVTAGSRQNPAVLVLHGFTGTHRSWNPILHQLSASYWVVMPDLPGHGASSIPDDARELSMEHTAHRLAQLLDALSIDKVAVIGYSMGGRLALHMAWLRQERLWALALESASPGIRDAKDREARRRQDAELADQIETRGLPWFIEHWNSQPLFRFQSATLQAFENQIRRQQNAYGLAQSLRGAGTGSQGSLWDVLPAIHVPTLLITGDQDKKFHQTGEAMRKLIPKAQWVSIEQAGHTVHGEQPERFSDTVVPFLNTHRSPKDRIAEEDLL